MEIPKSYLTRARREHKDDEKKTPGACKAPGVYQPRGQTLRYLSMISAVT